MVDNKVESNISQVHLLNLIIKLTSLQNFKGISIDEKNFIGFDLSMTTLYTGFIQVYAVFRLKSVLFSI